jgi:hypothetical protein
MLFVIFIELSTSFSIAYQPYNTEDAIMTPKEDVGIQIENLFTTQNGGNQNETTFNLLYGVVDWIEADIVFALLDLRPDPGQNEFGLSDTLLFSKIKILGDDGYFHGNEFLPDIVLEPSVLVPTGDEAKGLGGGKIQLGILLVLEKQFWKVAGRANFGHFASNETTFNENFVNQFFYGVQIDFPVFTDRFRLGTELTGEFGEDIGAPLFSLTGFIFQITDNIVLDAGVEIGLSDAGVKLGVKQEASQVTVITGLSFGFSPFEWFVSNE